MILPEDNFITMPTKQYPNNCLFGKFQYFSTWNVFELFLKKTDRYAYYQSIQYIELYCLKTDNIQGMNNPLKKTFKSRMVLKSECKIIIFAKYC